MEASKREQVDEEIRRRCDAGDYSGAAGLALESYGLDFHHLMMAVLKHRDWADEAFSSFSEGLLKSLPSFRWESSFRTWAYRVVRHTCAQYLRSQHGRERWATDGALADQPHPERSMTQPWLRTDVKHRFRDLHAQLTPLEQRILTLRIHDGLSWNEVARAMAGHELEAEDLKHRAAVLRQQYQRLKVHLRELAIDASLISSGLP